MTRPPDGWTPAIARTSAAAIDLALSLLPAAPAPDGRVYKTDRDYATTSDYLIEDRVREFLDHATPDIGCLGEERGHTGNTETYWCLDPIDGTTNYAHSIPLYGVSIALVNNGDPVHGEIALPAIRERYATRLEGATLNNSPISVRQASSLAEAVVSVGDFASGEGAVEKNAQRLATITILANRVARIRMFGAAAIDFAWLAAGRLDAVIMHSRRPWDILAGQAIAYRAGALLYENVKSDLDDGVVAETLITAPQGSLVSQILKGTPSSL